MDYVEARSHLVAWLRSRMIGPATKDAIIKENPLELYHVGVLSPLEFTSTLHIDLPKVTQLNEFSNGAVNPNEDFLYRRYYTAPSSVGFTFFVSQNAQLSISASATRYKSLAKRDEFGKYVKQIYRREEQPDFELTIDQPCNILKQAIWQDHAYIMLVPRPQANGILCTLTLSNSESGPKSVRHSDKAESCLFEVGLKCTIESGDILELPRTPASMMSDEELEFELESAVSSNSLCISSRLVSTGLPLWGLFSI